MFFSPEFKVDLAWKGQHHLKVGSVLPQNARQISESLKDFSPESIRNRFLGGKKEFTPQELEYFTRLDGINHYAIGVEESNETQRGVAIVRLVRSSTDPSEAEVAIMIIDDFQKMGLGFFLINMIVLAAFERKIERLSFTFFPQNEGIARLINKVGTPVAGAHSHDFVQLFLEMKSLPLEKIKAQLAQYLQSIDTFPIKT